MQKKKNYCFYFKNATEMTFTKKNALEIFFTIKCTEMIFTIQMRWK